MIWLTLAVALAVTLFLVRMMRRRDLISMSASEPMSSAALGFSRTMTPQKKAALRAANQILR
jgi:hypothetical protein